MSAAQSVSGAWTCKPSSVTLLKVKLSGVAEQGYTILYGKCQIDNFY